MTHIERGGEPLGPGILQDGEYSARLLKETLKTVTRQSALDNTGAICVPAAELANPSGQMRDLPELQPLILTAQKYLQPYAKHRPGSEVLASKPLAARLSPTRIAGKSPESLRKGGRGWEPSQALRSQRFPSSHRAFPLLYYPAATQPRARACLSLLVLSNTIVSPPRVLRHGRAAPAWLRAFICYGNALLSKDPFMPPAAPRHLPEPSSAAGSPTSRQPCREGGAGTFSGRRSERSRSVEGTEQPPPSFINAAREPGAGGPPFPPPRPRPQLRPRGCARRQL